MLRVGSGIVRKVNAGGEKLVVQGRAASFDFFAGASGQGRDSSEDRVHFVAVRDAEVLGE